MIALSKNLTFAIFTWDILGELFICLFLLRENCYFCAAFAKGPIVKWIEWRIPVPLIWVRIPVGSRQ